jgi:hypothetical protein
MLRKDLSNLHLVKITNRTTAVRKLTALLKKHPSKLMDKNYVLKGRR